jgi:hypothetical protein
MIHSQAQGLLASLLQILSLITQRHKLVKQQRMHLYRYLHKSKMLVRQD